MSLVHYSPAAREDLLEIWLHIAADSPKAADGFLERLYGVCQLLVAHPGIGTRRPELGPLTCGFAVGQYIIFYEPTSRGVKVLRVLHGARDVPPLFGGPYDA